nr:MAG TPA: hypothetical protein [Caudoviricetes sp.]
MSTATDFQTNQANPRILLHKNNIWRCTQKRLFQLCFPQIL